MAADPAILLMDEPFGAIDAITRTRLQDELMRIQSQVHKTVLFVTHDVEEALKLADVLVVMRDGRIVQAGPPRAILAHPATPFVAQLVGAGGHPAADSAWCRSPISCAPTLISHI